MSRGVGGISGGKPSAYDDFAGQSATANGKSTGCCICSTCSSGACFIEATVPTRIRPSRLPRPRHSHLPTASTIPMRSVLRTAVVLFALFPAAVASGSCSRGLWVVDWHAWWATTCAPFDLETMRAYYVPRTPACCGESLYWVGPPCCCAPEISDGFEPSGFEHLGQIPNDLLLEDSRPSR